MTYPQSEFPDPPYVDTKYGIVRINGELTWVTSEKMAEYNERLEALGGDWSWEQEVGLDQLRAQRTLQVFNEVNERVEAKRREFAIQESIATHMVMARAAGWDVNPDGSFNPPRPDVSLRVRDGVLRLKPPRTELEKLKRVRRRFTWILFLLVTIAFSNVFTMPHVDAWLQDFMVGTWLPAAAVTVYNLERTRGKIKAAEIRNTINYTPLPVEHIPPKPRSEQYADKFVETGQLMYKYLMEDAYAREHEHDFDIKELS